MIYVYVGFIIALFLACVYFVIEFERLNGDEFEFNTVDEFEFNTGDEFEFNTGDEFYVAEVFNNKIIVTKRVVKGVSIKNKKLYLSYSNGLFCDTFDCLYDVCGKTEKEAIDKLKKKICCSNNKEA
jgi:hypothetical protein